MEWWCDIAGYEGLYLISSLGRVKSFHGNGKIMERKTVCGYYPSVTLCKNGIHKTFRIHRLVAAAYIPNLRNCLEINHKDMNRANNTVYNLEWVSRRENILHAVKNKPQMIVAMNYYNTDVKTMKVKQMDFNGQIIAIWKNCVEAAKGTGICTRNIHQVASKSEYKPGKTRSQAGGFKWEFIQKGADNET